MGFSNKDNIIPPDIIKTVLEIVQAKSTFFVIFEGHFVKLVVFYDTTCTMLSILLLQIQVNRDLYD